MGMVSVSTKYGPIDVKIKGLEPSAKEFLQLDDIYRNPEKYLPKETVAATFKQKGVRSRI
jgi:hypothetical protein